MALQDSTLFSGAEVGVHVF